jgi:hypothetical protein
MLEDVIVNSRHREERMIWLKTNVDVALVVDPATAFPPTVSLTARFSCNDSTVIQGASNRTIVDL